MTGDQLPDHVAANRVAWDRDAPEYVASGERSWRLLPGEETWGLFGNPESEIGMLPDDLEGLDAIELGCGTAYGSAWLARRGARPEFHLPHGEWNRLFRESGFEIEALVEPRAPEGSTTSYAWAPYPWARR